MNESVLETKSHYQNTRRLKPGLFVFLIFMLVGLVFLLIDSFKNAISEKSVLSLETAESTASTVFGELAEPSPFASLLDPLYQPPVRLLVEKLNISAEIIPVTIEDGKYLETPKDWGQTGWFKRGAQAGQYGNLLLNGHYDTNLGGPAAFWELKNIEPGDKVVVEDRLGRTFSYTVLEKYYIDINDPDRTKVFASDGNKKELTLITCGGVWLPGQGTYNQRLIVRGELLD